MISEEVKEKLLLSKGVSAPYDELVDRCIAWENLDIIDEPLLLMAVRYDKMDIVHLLLENGVNVNSCNIFGTTALMEAIRKRNEDMVLLLLENGADPNKKDVDGWTAEAYASFKAGDEIIKILREAKKTYRSNRKYEKGLKTLEDDIRRVLKL